MSVAKFLSLFVPVIIQPVFGCIMVMGQPDIKIFDFRFSRIFIYFLGFRIFPGQEQFYGWIYCYILFLLIFDFQPPEKYFIILVKPGNSFGLG